MGIIPPKKVFSVFGSLLMNLWVRLGYGQGSKLGWHCCHDTLRSGSLPPHSLTKNKHKTLKPPFVGHYFDTTRKFEAYLSSQTIDALRLGLSFLKLWMLMAARLEVQSALIQFIIPTEGSRIGRQAAFSTGKESNPATSLDLLLRQIQHLQSESSLPPDMSIE